MRITPKTRNSHNSCSSLFWPQGYQIKARPRALHLNWGSGKTLHLGNKTKQLFTWTCSGTSPSLLLTRHWLAGSRNWELAQSSWVHKVSSDAHMHRMIKSKLLLLDLHFTRQAWTLVVSEHNQPGASNQWTPCWFKKHPRRVPRKFRSTVASMLFIFPCVKLHCVSSASETCFDYVWSVNVFMLSFWAILPAQVSLPSLVEVVGLLHSWIRSPSRPLNKDHVDLVCVTVQIWGPGPKTAPENGTQNKDRTQFKTPKCNPGAQICTETQTRTCRDDLHSAVGLPGNLIQLCNKPTTSTNEGRETWAGKIAQTHSMNLHRPNIVKTCFTCRRYTVKFHAWENQQHARYYGGTPMRHRKTACFEALVLEPHLAQSCARFLLLYCLLGWGSSLQRLKVAAHVLVKPWFAALPPCTFQCFVRKVKKCPLKM